MIRKIKTRFIMLAMTALFVLLASIVLGMNTINYNAIVREADVKLNLLSQNKGTFPDFGPREFDGNKRRRIPSGMTVETPYEARYFSVLLMETGEVLQADTLRIRAIDDAAAVQYAAKALQAKSSRDFIGKYRFLRAAEGAAVRITFLDCSREFFSFKRFFVASSCMALVGYLLFFFVIFFFSGRIIKPVTESYEKQRRFITDAGHEIKTPLAIIKADVDVLEMEYGENEWLDGIHAQVKRLADLTADLVYLSRIEETTDGLQMIEFPFSDVVSETAQAFDAVAQAQNKTFQCSIQPMLSFTGNEKSIRQLVNILLDNAMKYSPEGGLVSLCAKKQGKYLCLSVFNTSVDPIDKQEVPRFFERFYRMDVSRSSKTGGYGIGLSVAKAIVDTHKGKITAATPDGQSLQVDVQFPVL